MDPARQFPRIESRRRTCASLALTAVATLIVSCGAASGPTSSSTSTPTTAPSFTPAATVTPAPSSTAAASSNELTALAAQVYPPCTPATCAASGSMFTTCEAGSSGSDVFASCPLTPRLATQLQAVAASVVSAPDPLGGGQDPEWTTETFAATPSSTGGVVHVTLGVGQGNPEKLDLVVLLTGSQLLVDDIYCTGSDPVAGDAFADGWVARSACST
jgi:hypothetical protein